MPSYIAVLQEYSRAFDVMACDTVSNLSQTHKDSYTVFIWVFASL